MAGHFRRQGRLLLDERRHASRWRRTRKEGFEYIAIPPVEMPTEPGAGIETSWPSMGSEVDIVICVHNALDDVRACLESVKKYSRIPYRLLIVDDGSDADTASFWDDFVAQPEIDGTKVSLQRNAGAKGYTRAANQGLAAGSAPFTVLLNSDTEVGPEWLERMIATMLSDEKTGMVGPLSNAAPISPCPTR